MDKIENREDIVLSIDVPQCSFKHGSEVQNYREKYTAVAVSDFAYLWTPANHSHHEIKNLIITAHGGFWNAEPRLTFKVPAAFTLNFYCEDKHILWEFDLEYLYNNRLRLIPTESVNGGMVCYDYQLMKYTSSQYTERNNMNESYDSIQTLVSFRESIVKQRLKKAKKELAEYEKQTNLSFKEYRARVSKAEINILLSYDYYCSDKYRLLWEKGKIVETLTQELTEPCSILTIRNRSYYEGEGILLSRLLKELSKNNYAFKRIDCLFCRVDLDLGEEGINEVNYFPLYLDSNYSEKTQKESSQKRTKVTEIEIKKAKEISKKRLWERLWARKKSNNRKKKEQRKGLSTAHSA